MLLYLYILVKLSDMYVSKFVLFQIVTFRFKWRIMHVYPFDATGIALLEIFAIVAVFVEIFVSFFNLSASSKHRLAPVNNPFLHYRS